MLNLLIYINNRGSHGPRLRTSSVDDRIANLLQFH